MQRADESIGRGGRHGDSTRRSDNDLDQQAKRVADGVGARPNEGKRPGCVWCGTGVSVGSPQN